MIYLAFRRDAPTGANWLQRLFCWAIKTRLVSQYCHGGIVIDGALHHITAAGGFEVCNPGEWSPERWDLVPDHGADPDIAAARFYELAAPNIKGWRLRVWRIVKGYDYFSLLAFVGLPMRVSWLVYCFELMRYMRTGEKPRGRVTPEQLIAGAIV